MKRHLPAAIVALVALLFGLGIGKKLWRQGVVKVPGTTTVRVDTIHGKVPEPTTIKGRIRERVVYRTVESKLTQEAPVSPTTIEQERKNAGESMDQVSFRKGQLSVFTHNDSIEKKYSFPVKGPFDVTLRNGVPHVRTPRCVVCDPRLSVEVGYEWQSEHQQSYIAAEASAAVINRDIHLFVRPELGSEAQVRVGVKYTF